MVESYAQHQRNVKKAAEEKAHFKAQEEAWKTGYEAAMAANEASMAPFRAQEAAWKQGIDAAKKVNAMNDPKVAA